MNDAELRAGIETELTRWREVLDRPPAGFADQPDPAPGPDGRTPPTLADWDRFVRSWIGLWQGLDARFFPADEELATAAAQHDDALLEAVAERLQESRDQLAMLVRHLTATEDPEWVLPDEMRPQAEAWHRHATTVTGLLEEVTARLGEDPDGN